MMTDSASICSPSVVSIPCHHSALGQDSQNVPLQKIEVRFSLDQRLHPELVRLFVTLRPGGPHARTFVAVQRSELDSGGIGVEAHHAAQGINLPHHVTLGQSADRRVARHLPNGIQILGQHQRSTTQARRGHRGLDAGMTPADHQHLVQLRIDEHSRIVAHPDKKSIAVGPGS